MNIYNLLKSKTHNIHHLNRYHKFVMVCNLKNKNIGIKHHILPKSMFPEYNNLKNNPWNLARLSSREHFICHIMLWKVYNNHSMSYAVYMMKKQHNKTMNSKMYYKLYNDNIEHISKMNKGKIVVKNLNNDIFKVDVNDSRYLSGELVGITKGIKIERQICKYCNGEYAKKRNNKIS